MSGLLFGRLVSRKSTVFPGALLIGAIACALAACSGGSLSGQAKDAPIRVESSQFSVTIENRAGLTLQELDIAILPIGSALPFTHFLGRLDAGEKRESAVDEFRDRDGMKLNLRVVRPKTIRVTAKDLNGKPYKIEVPWS